MEKIPVFPITENIFTVADELETACLKQSESYYAIVDDLGKFCGMFSSKDLLIFLSAITKEEIELARKIQSRLIQEYAVYHWNRFEVVCSSQMAKAVGGDFYWVKSYDPYRYLVTLCDVSGKGMAASLVSSVLAGMLTTYNFTQGIKGFISLLNRFIYQSLAEEKFVTGVFIDIDIRTGSLRVFDMGHGLCHLYRNHRLHTMKTPVSSPPLGLQDDLNPRGFVLHLKPGDLLILHSDGLTEQRNSSGTEYSLTRVTRFIEEEGDVDLEKLNVQILEDFHQHRRMIPQGDDVTLLLLKWNAISS
jgi:sigma-B regulation protein RsbU (phosphoserine phosphatase)